MIKDPSNSSKSACPTACGNIGFIFLFILLGIGLFFLFQHISEKRKIEQVSQSHYGTWLESPQPIAAFSLESTNGGTFTEESFKGHWSTVFFGFTRCPDMCPHAMQVFKTIIEALQQAKVTPLPQILFVTVDPTYDTLPILQKYVTSYNSQFIGLRGDLSQVNILAKQMGVAYKNLGGAKIQHSGTVTIINPQGRIQAFFPWTDDPIKMAADYEAMLKAWH